MESVAALLLLWTLGVDRVTCKAPPHRVYDFPRRVVNFSCTWTRLEVFSCEWAHPVEYEDLSQIAVTFEWKKGRDKRFNTCTRVKDLTSCEDIPNISVLSNKFRVNVTNTRTQAQSSAVFDGSFPREKYGKPGRPTDLIVSEINSTSVSLKWMSDLGTFEFAVRHNCTGSERTEYFNSRSTNIESVRIGYLHNLKNAVITGLPLVSTEQCLFEVTARYCSFFDDTEPVGLSSDPAVVYYKSDSG